MPPFPRDIMKWTDEMVYSPLFQQMIERRRHEQQGTQQQQEHSTNGACITETDGFKLLEHDYVLGEQKVSLSAQSWVIYLSSLCVV